MIMMSISYEYRIIADDNILMAPWVYRFAVGNIRLRPMIRHCDSCGCSNYGILREIMAHEKYPQRKRSRITIKNVVTAVNELITP